MGAGETQDPRLRAPRLRAPGPGRHSLRFCRCQRFICNKQRDCPVGDSQQKPVFTWNFRWNRPWPRTY